MPVDLQNRYVRNEIKYLGSDLNRRKNYTIENVLPPAAISHQNQCRCITFFLLLFFLLLQKQKLNAEYNYNWFYALENDHYARVNPMKTLKV